VSSLSDLELPFYLDSSNSDLVTDFFLPMLLNSVKYDRGVGYFSSGWLRVAAKGMAGFASNGGHARWITSPILSENDWRALQAGNSARTDEILYSILERNTDDLLETLEKDTLSALAWLIADNVIDFKLALPRNKLDHGEFHDKFGIFTDVFGHHVSFNGSYNDSMQGLRNYESIKIFCSWDSRFEDLVDSDIKRFEILWENLDPNVQVFDLSSAVREKIIKLRFTKQRPYQIPIFANALLVGPTKPQIPSGVKLREYQEEAISLWFSNNFRGIVEMATGTGKTITSLVAAIRLSDIQHRQILVVIVPYKHLVEQWAEEAEKFGFRPLKVVESSRIWEPELTRQIQAFKLGLINYVSLIATNDALESGKLSAILNGAWEKVLLIIDEVHHAGAPGMLRSLPYETTWRLGLSATPIRHYDELGTDALIVFFGDIIFQFGLDKAIGQYLTPYYYYPTPVEMTEDEFAEYCRLTKQLGKYLSTSEGEMPEAAKRIAIKRARVLNNSVSKLDWLRQNIEKYNKIKYALFYVGESLFAPAKAILGIEKRLRIHEFTQKQNNEERKHILEQFGKGELQALIAMKCLDEGVDIPPTREAYFLASSGNPREFIQRRGRVLRLFEGKDFAIIRDLISIPPMDFIEIGSSHPDYSSVRSSFLREYKRVKEFAGLAINHYQALEPMFDIAEKLDLLDA
jgi:superfamily II DNA or RNA helicase